jgi:hypothetical protein
MISSPASSQLISSNKRVTHNVRSPRDRARSLRKAVPSRVAVSRVVGRAQGEDARGIGTGVLECSREAVDEHGGSDLSVAFRVEEKVSSEFVRLDSPKER